MQQSTHGPSRATAFVVDNDRSVRESLSWLLQSAGIAVQSFTSGEEFLRRYDVAPPGCLILDVRLPGMSGIALQEELKRRGIDLPVIIVTGYADVTTAVRALKGGAVDFIEKPFADQQIVERVCQAIEVDRERRRASVERERLTARLAQLTARERAVFDQVVVGKANKVVALEFGISEKTVEAHRSRMMQKLGATTLAELVRMDLMTHELDAWLGLAARAAGGVPPGLGKAAAPNDYRHVRAA